MADKDLDGIPDMIDKNPNQFDRTPQNGGRPVGSGYNSSFVPDVPNITLPGYDRPVNAAEAKDWFKFADTRGGAAAQAKARFLAAVAQLGIPAKKASAVWSDAIEWTQSVGSTTDRPDGYLSVLNPSLYTGGGTTGPKYGTSKSTDTRVTQYSPSSAAQTASDTFEQELGRTASKAEIAAYTSAVNAAAKKEPSTYTGVTTTSPGGKGFAMGESKSSGTQTTGFDPTMFARNFARSQPDYAESFAAKNFLGIIQSLLKDPNAIGQVVGNGRQNNGKVWTDSFWYCQG